MANKMLIDAAHPEETRVVVLRGNRVEEFDFESASKKPLRGNIYLAKVTRVEPSLQAAFIEYGGNRHGFLAFSEIHPDYYQIPVADRQALLEEEARAHREEDEEPRQSNGRRSRRRRTGGPQSSEKRAETGDETVSEQLDEEDGDTLEGSPEESLAEGIVVPTEPGDTDEPTLFSVTEDNGNEGEPASSNEDSQEFIETIAETADLDDAANAQDDASAYRSDDAQSNGIVVDAEAHVSFDDAALDDHADEAEGDAEQDVVEQIGGDSSEDVPMRTPRVRRHYKIQEVIKRRQILLVQVVKEERGNKGAALTTYLSLAGRYSVLMPNTARGGGISRKITDAEDRKRLKSIAQQLDVPEGMGIILRTAGAARSDQEVRRDFEYLLRMWETVRELTLKSSAPTLVYEEGSLIKRAIRDLYSKEIDEVCVAGDTGYREAKDYMRLLMPTHAKNVQLYRDPQPIFAKSGVEAQLDAMFSNHVTLRSGGYIVINQTEALVAIDVNSGRSTREHNIEDTAVRTNLEAADEVARQLRLRDLAGLIVVDFIDMEEGRNNRAVERRIKDALKNDRARIQIGRISHFGLLEMSRQRIRTGVLEGSTVLCPHCAGAGTVRSTSSIALHVLRVLEDTLIRSATHNLVVRTRSEVAIYILNQKRSHLTDLEQRFGVTITVLADAMLTGTVYHALERGELATPVPLVARQSPSAQPIDAEDDDIVEEVAEDEDVSDDTEDAADAGDEQTGATRAEDAEAPGDRRRRRRRRRRGRDKDPRETSESAQEDLSEGTADASSLDESDPVENASRFEQLLDAPEVEDSVEPEPEVEPAPDDAVAVEAAATVDESAEPTLVEGDTETAKTEPEQAPRRRRTRRNVSRVTPPVDQGEAAASEASDEAPAPRRSRRVAKARSAVEPAPTLALESPSVGPDVDADTAQNNPVEEMPVEAAAPVSLTEAAPPKAEAPTEAEASAPLPSPEPATTPAVEEPARPKRSGWWQRAKATLTG